MKPHTPTIVPILQMRRLKPRGVKHLRAPTKLRWLGSSDTRCVCETHKGTHEGIGPVKSSRVGTTNPRESQLKLRNKRERVL